MANLTWQNVRAWRTSTQGLDRRVPGSEMLEVTGRICGLHAQLMSSAELSLWARLEGVSAGVAARALWEDRSLVKFWAMRGTLHLLPAAEYWTWQAALSTYDHYLKPSWFKHFGMTMEQLEQMIEAVGEVLDGRILTREQLAEAVAERVGAADLGEKLLQSWGAFLKPPSFHGKLCFGPGAGTRVCFTGPAWWLGGRVPVAPEEAVAEMTRRYLGSNGPATAEDYGRWAAVSPAKARARFRRLGDEAAEVEVEGVRCWMPARDVDGAASASPSGRVNLLPAFDPYVIAATRQWENFTPGPYKERIYRPQGWISPVVLVDGRMDGVWSHRERGGRLLVTVELFVEVPPWAKTGIEEQAHHLAGFLGREGVEVSFTEPTAPG